MANQKITARVSLTSNNLDPVNDILGIVDVSAGSSGSKKITPNALFTGWGFTSDGAVLAKGTKEQQKEALDLNNLIYDPAITGLTGGGVTNLDGVPTAGLADGQMRIVRISGNLYIYRGTVYAIGQVTQPGTIVSADRPTEYRWFLQTFDLQILRTISIKINGNVFTGSEAGPFINYLPEDHGTIALSTVAYVSEPLTGESTTIPRYTDYAHYAIPAGVIATHTLNFPNKSDCRNGQCVSFSTSQNITSITVNPGTGNTLGGTALTACVANNTYAWTYFSDASKWVRQA